MSRRLKIWFSTAAAAVLSGLYWLLFFLFAETFTAADYRAGDEPGEAFIRAKIAAALVVGPALYALCIAGWRRLERRLLK